MVFPGVPTPTGEIMVTEQNTAAQVARLRDPRRDPKAGDVLIYGPQWQRSRIEVREIRDGFVLAVMDGRAECVYHPNQWREWMADAEVVRVAAE